MAKGMKIPVDQELTPDAEVEAARKRRARFGMKIPVDQELTRCLQFDDGTLGCRGTQREGGCGSFGGDHERAIVDERFSFNGAPPAAVQAARERRARFAALSVHRQRVLAAVYGLSLEALRAQIEAASNLETWHRVESSFGQAAPLGFMLSPQCDNGPRVRRLDEVGGPWCTPRGRQFLAMCAARGPVLDAAMAKATEELADALSGWWGLPRARVA